MVKHSLCQDWLGELPDELLCNMLQLSWSLDTRERTRAEEVRCALQLRSVCQRVGRLLRAQPLPLRLDSSLPLGSGTGFQQKHLHWLASAAQQDSVASLTRRGWDMSWEQRHAAAVRTQRSPARVTLTESQLLQVLAGKYLVDVTEAQLVQVLAGNQRRSLRRLHGIWADDVGHAKWQVDLSAFALTHVGLMLGHIVHVVCAAALPGTLETLACYKLWNYEGPGGGDMEALLHNVCLLPCLARIHMRCHKICLPPETAVWSGKHVVLTAENVLLHFRESPEGGLGVFGAAASVRIVVGTIEFMFGHMEQVSALAYMLCPDTLGEAVLETDIQRGVEYTYNFMAIPPAMEWRQVLHALIVGRGDLFAFEVETKLGRIRLAWKRWPPSGTRARDAAAKLHRQSADWAGVELACQPALL